MRPAAKASPFDDDDDDTPAPPPSSSQRGRTSAAAPAPSKAPAAAKANPFADDDDDDEDARPVKAAAPRTLAAVSRPLPGSAPASAPAAAAAPAKKAAATKSPFDDDGDDAPPAKAPSKTKSPFDDDDDAKPSAAPAASAAPPKASSAPAPAAPAAPAAKPAANPFGDDDDDDAAASGSGATDASGKKKETKEEKRERKERERLEKERERLEKEREKEEKEREKREKKEREKAEKEQAKAAKAEEKKAGKGKDKDKGKEKDKDASVAPAPPAAAAAAGSAAAAPLASPRGPTKSPFDDGSDDEGAAVSASKPVAVPVAAKAAAATAAKASGAAPSASPFDDDAPAAAKPVKSAPAKGPFDDDAPPGKPVKSGPAKGPFDDDAPAAAAKPAKAGPVKGPFDDDAPAKPAKAGPTKSPFDDDAPAKPAKAGPTKSPFDDDAPAKPAKAGPTKSPFDDEPAVKPAKAGPSKSPFDDDAPAPAKPAKAGPSKSPFDDEPAPAPKQAASTPAKAPAKPAAKAKSPFDEDEEDEVAAPAPGAEAPNPFGVGAAERARASQTKGPAVLSLGTDLPRKPAPPANPFGDDDVDAPAAGGAARKPANPFGDDDDDDDDDRVASDAAAAAKAGGRRAGHGHESESESGRNALDDLDVLPEGGDVDVYVRSVLRETHTVWPDVLSAGDKFNPVALALSVLAGQAGENRDLDALRERADTLDDARNRIVDKYHHGFNDSIQKFSNIVLHVTAAQEQVRNLRSNMLETHRQLQLLVTKRDALSRLWYRTLEYKESLKLLAKIEELKRVPAKVELLLAQKHYLLATKLVLDACRLLDTEGLTGIGALADLRRILDQRRNSMHEQIIDDLQAELFLRSAAPPTAPATPTPHASAAAVRRVLQDADNRGPTGDPWDDSAHLFDDGRSAPAASAASARRTDADVDTSTRLGRAATASGKPLSPFSPTPGQLTSEAASTASLPLSPTTAVATTAVTTTASSKSAVFSRTSSAAAGTDAPSFSLSSAAGRHPLVDLDVEDEETRPAHEPASRYIAIMIEALARLRKLPVAMAAFKRTLKVELFFLAEAAIEEASAKAADKAQHFSGAPGEARTDPLRSDAARNATFGQFPYKSRVTEWNQHTVRQTQAEQLDVLLRALYGRYTRAFRRIDFALARILNVMPAAPANAAPTPSKSNARATMPEDYQVPTALSVWVAIQEEIETLLQDYLQDPLVQAAENAERELANAAPQPGAHLRPGAHRTDGTKLFAFANTEAAINMAIYYRDRRRDRDREGRPSGAPNKGALGPTSVLQSEDDVLDDMYFGKATGKGGHRLLLTADPNNLTVIFRPTFAFATLLDAVATGQSGGGCLLTAFLNNFVLSSFVPLIKGHVQKQMSSSIQYAPGPLAAKTELIVLAESPQPVLKSAALVLGLVRELGRISAAVPLHQDRHVALVEHLLSEYLVTCTRLIAGIAVLPTDDKAAKPTPALCVDWLANADVQKHLLRQPSLRAAMVAATSPTPTVSPSGAFASDIAAMPDALAAVELGLKGAEMVSRDTLLWDPAKLQLLATFHHSLTWLLRHLGELVQPLPAAAPASVAADAAEHAPWILDLDHVGRRAAGADAPADESVALHLDPAALARFEELEGKFREQAQHCLLLLRVEIRCRIHYFVDLAVREGSYAPEGETVEADPYVAALAKDLLSTEDALLRRLPATSFSYVYDEAAALLGSLLCLNARYVGRMNRNGTLKMARNLFSLQECLTEAAVPVRVLEAHLDRARQLYAVLNCDLETLAPHLANLGTRYTLGEFQAVLGLAQRSAAALGQDETTYPSLLQEHLDTLTRTLGTR